MYMEYDACFKRQNKNVKCGNSQLSTLCIKNMKRLGFGTLVIWLLYSSMVIFKRNYKLRIQ